MFKALVLSHIKGIVSVNTLKSSSCYLIHNNCDHLATIATYLASKEDNTIEFCFLVPRKLVKIPKTKPFQKYFCDQSSTDQNLSILFVAFK